VKKHPLLGKFLREKRVAASFSQGQLAHCLGYHAQFVSNWERGVSGPPAEMMKKIITVLKIPGEEILDLLTEESSIYWNQIIFPAGRRRNKKKKLKARLLS